MTAPHPSDPVSPDADGTIERALSAGRAHEDAGRLLNAVVEYDRAQRLCSDADLAHRIVHVRHEAMAGATVGPRAPCWPRTMEDRWYQDGSFMGSEVRSVDEILDTQTRGATYSISIGDELVDIVGGDRPWISPQLLPDDVVFFDERFVRRSRTIDGVTSSRYAIESWFFATSTVPGAYVPIPV